MFIPKLIATAVAGYLLGNIEAGILIAKAYGVWDIRKHGSGNSGTTNVLRTLGWLPGALTLICDCLKGFLAAELGMILCGDVGLLIGGFCAVIGHDYPVFMGFKGGKGIATSMGMMLALDPRIALVGVVVVLGVVIATGYMSLGSVLACILCPIAAAIILRARPYYPLCVITICAIALLTIYRHRENIKRLSEHSENRLDHRRISRVSAKVMDRMRKRNECKKSKKKG